MHVYGYMDLKQPNDPTPPTTKLYTFQTELWFSTGLIDSLWGSSHGV